MEMHGTASGRGQGASVTGQPTGSEKRGPFHDKDQRTGAGQRDAEDYARPPYPSIPARWRAEQNGVREPMQNHSTRHMAYAGPRYGEQDRGFGTRERSADCGQPDSSNYNVGAQELRRVRWAQEGKTGTKGIDERLARGMGPTRMAWQHRIRATADFPRASRHLETEV